MSLLVLLGLRPSIPETPVVVPPTPPAPQALVAAPAIPVAQTGDAADMARRVKINLPPWFGAITPILDGLVAGVAANLAWGYSLLGFTRLQTRIKSATGGWLDLIAWDFFGTRFIRRKREIDTVWRGRILPEILRERGTRKGVIQAVFDLTGRTPVMTEPTNPFDNGVYSGPYLGYGAAGHYGTLLMPAQAFLTAFRPSSSGIPEAPGYGATVASTGHIILGYGFAGKYASLDEIQGAVTDAMIYQTVADTQSAGVTIWTSISS